MRVLVTSVTSAIVAALKLRPIAEQSAHLITSRVVGEELAETKKSIQNYTDQLAGDRFHPEAVSVLKGMGSTLIPITPAVKDLTEQLSRSQALNCELQREFTPESAVSRPPRMQQQHSRPCSRSKCEYRVKLSGLLPTASQG